jgi:hypothetical protein
MRNSVPPEQVEQTLRDLLEREKKKKREEEEERERAREGERSTRTCTQCS